MERSVDDGAWAWVAADALTVDGVVGSGLGMERSVGDGAWAWVAADADAEDGTWA